MSEADLSARAAVRAVAAWPFEGRSAYPIGTRDPQLEHDLLARVSEQRLTGLAIAAHHAGDLQLSSDSVDELFARHEGQLATDLRLERVLVETAAMFDRAGIAYRALKGPLLAHTDYEDPALRSFGDVDVLVRADDFGAAILTLELSAFERGFMEPRHGFDARFSKGACLLRADGIEVDLHRTLAPGAFGVMLARVGLLEHPPRRFWLGAHEIDGLDRELAFVHACFHAALGNHPPRLSPLRDIVQILRAGVASDAVIELATATHCESVFQRAIGLVAVVLGLELRGAIPDWANAYRPTRFDRWALQSYADADRSYAGQVATSLWALPSLGDRLAYVAALVFPTRDYVRARERGYARRLARGFRVIKDSRPR